MAPYVPLFQSLISVTGVITAAVIAAILARSSYVRQKEIDRDEDLRTRRAEEYERYMKAFREVFRHTERLHQQSGESQDTEHYLGEARARYDEASNYLVVIASDEVFLCATALNASLSKHYDHELIDTDKMRVDEEIREIYTDLIAAMRRDCFEKKTKLSKEEISSRLAW
jgi:hypothetical protein